MGKKKGFLIVTIPIAIAMLGGLIALQVWNNRIYEQYKIDAKADMIFLQTKYDSVLIDMTNVLIKAKSEIDSLELIIKNR